MASSQAHDAWENAIERCISSPLGKMAPLSLTEPLPSFFLPPSSIPHALLAQGHKSAVVYENLQPMQLYEPLWFLIGRSWSHGKEP